jgi:hypothetical protein
MKSEIYSFHQSSPQAELPGALKYFTVMAGKNIGFRIYKIKCCISFWPINELKIVIED